MTVSAATCLRCCVACGRLGGGPPYRRDSDASEDDDLLGGVPGPAAASTASTLQSHRSHNPDVVRIQPTRFSPSPSPPLRNLTHSCMRSPQAHLQWLPFAALRAGLCALLCLLSVRGTAYLLLTVCLGCRLLLCVIVGWFRAAHAQVLLPLSDHDLRAAESALEALNRVLVTVQDNPLFILPSVAGEARSLQPLVHTALDRVAITTASLQGGGGAGGAGDGDLDLAFLGRLLQFGDDASLTLRRYDSMAALLALA